MCASGTPARERSSSLRRQSIPLFLAKHAVLKLLQTCSANPLLDGRRNAAFTKVGQPRFHKQLKTEAAEIMNRRLYMFEIRLQNFFGAPGKIRQLRPFLRVVLPEI